MFKKILLATDGSPASTRAAELAVGLARTCGASMAVVYVVDPYPYLGVGDTNPLGFQAYMSAAYRTCGAGSRQGGSVGVQGRASRWSSSGGLPKTSTRPRASFRPPPRRAPT